MRGRERLRGCRDYLAVKEHIIASDSDADFRVQRAKGVDGDALALTSTASTAARSALPKDFLIVTETRLYPAAPANARVERTQAAIRVMVWMLRLRAVCEQGEDVFDASVSGT